MKTKNELNLQDILSANQRATNPKAKEVASIVTVEQAIKIQEIYNN